LREVAGYSWFHN